MPHIRFFQGAALCCLLALISNGDLALAKPDTFKSIKIQSDRASDPAQSAPAAVEPRILSPLNNNNYIFGAPISFIAVDDNHECDDTPYEVIWAFKKDGAVHPESYTFQTNRTLDSLGGTKLIPLPGTYTVSVSICGVASPEIKFTVSYGAKVLNQPHPDYEDHGVDPDCIEYGDEPNHATSAHFNLYWSSNNAGCDDPIEAPTEMEVGLLECTYFTLDLGMISPLSPVSIYRDHPDYDHLTHIPVYKGKEGGGGGSLPQGLIYGVQSTYWVFAHELFHVFDYAGNPLHNKFAFDFRYQNNAYHFYHESVTKIEQTVARDAATFWGYRTDTWKDWFPLDLGLLEMDYEGGPFWAYLMDTYGDDFAVGGRKTWEGPSFDACHRQVLTDIHGVAYRPHNFKFFEAWNAVVRNEVHLVDEGIRLDQYPGEYCILPEGNPDKSFLHVGQENPPCLQTVEYEMDVIEDLIKAQVVEQGTPLETSLMLDFAVAHAKAFPPNSLLNDTPQPVSCTASGRLHHVKGFGTGDPACGFDDPIPDANICPAARAVNEDDFYARIQFRILEPQAHYLWLRANDDATLYMDGKIVLGQEVDDNPSSEDFPNASTTYADQSLQWPENNAPVSSIFPVGNVVGKTFEIEWVNRGDARGNFDYADACSADHSRYLLELQWSNQPITSTFQILGDDKVQLIDAKFWPGQGSGVPGFRVPGPGGAIPRYDAYTSPTWHEIQLRPVSWLKRTFLLPALGVNYHPVQCPIAYDGDLEVLVVDDNLAGIHSKPEVHLLSLEAQDDVEWLGELDVVNALVHRSVLTCHGQAGAAQIGGVPAIILVTNKRTVTNPLENPYGQMGAVHYTVYVKTIDPFKLFLPLGRR